MKLAPIFSREDSNNAWAGTRINRAYQIVRHAAMVTRFQRWSQNWLGQAIGNGQTGRRGRSKRRSPIVGRAIMRDGRTSILTGLLCTTTTRSIARSLWLPGFKPLASIFSNKPVNHGGTQDEELLLNRDLVQGLRHLRACHRMGGQAS